MNIPLEYRRVPIAPSQRTGRVERAPRKAESEELMQENGYSPFYPKQKAIEHRLSLNTPSFLWFRPPAEPPDRNPEQEWTIAASRMASEGTTYENNSLSCGSEVEAKLAITCSAPA